MSRNNLCFTGFENERVILEELQGLSDTFKVVLQVVLFMLKLFLLLSLSGVFLFTALLSNVFIFVFRGALFILFKQWLQKALRFLPVLFYLFPIPLIMSDTAQVGQDQTRGYRHLREQNK